MPKFLPSICLLLALFAAACERQQGGGQQMGGPPPVTIATPLADSITEWEEFVGRFAAVERVDVRSQVSGELQSIAFEDGQMVEEGQLLFEIDPEPFRLALNASKADLAQARARLTFTTNDLKRAQNLRRRGNISEQAVDERLEAKQQAEASVAAALAAVELAELDLAYAKIEAPVAGRISRRYESVGNLVTGGAGGTLLTSIVSLDPIHFNFDANEAAYLSYARLAKKGERPSSRDARNPVELELINETGYPHKGEMDFVDNQIDALTATIRGRAIFSNPDLLFLPGMFGRMRLQGRADAPALLLPDDAVGTDQTSRFVMVVGEDDIVNPRRVEVGQLYKGLRIIFSGLEPEDRVVINGLMRIRPGSKIQPKPGTVSYPQAPAGAPASR